MGLRIEPEASLWVCPISISMGKIKASKNHDEGCGSVSFRYPNTTDKDIPNSLPFILLPPTINCICKPKNKMCAAREKK